MDYALELLLREPKKDFLAGEVKEFMCLAMLPPDLPVRFTAGVIGKLVGYGQFSGLVE